MFNPEFYISNRVLTNIVNIEKFIAQIKMLDLPAQQSLKLKAKAKSTNIFHLAHMISASMSIKDAERISEGRLFDQTSQQNIFLNNLRNLLEFVRSSLQDEYLDIDVSIILHMNKILLSNWKEVWDVKFRNPQLIEDNEWNDWLRLTDRTIEPLKLQDELRFAFDWYKISAPKLHPLLRIPVLLYRLIQLAPFSYANKFTIIGAADFLLKKHSYLAEDFLSTFRIFDSNNSTIIALIEKLNVEQNPDLTLWIEYFTEALANELGSINEEVKSTMNGSGSQKKTFLDLNRRQLKILKYLQTIPTVKREDYVQIMEVSTMTAFRDLNDLVTKKLLRINGRGRATKYMLINR